MATSPERLLISSVIRENKLGYAIRNNVSHDLFHLHNEEWAWLENYYKKYRKSPSRAAFINNFPGFTMKRVDDTELYVDEVKKSHGRYQLTSLIRDSADGIADGEIDSVIAKLQSEVLAIGTAMGAIKDIDVIKDWQDTYREAEERVKRFNSVGLAGIPTGFDTLDARTGGLQPGQLWVVAARLGEGKSWFLNQMATAAFLAGLDVHFAALEMSRTDVTFRMHNLISKHKGDGNIFQAQGLMQGQGTDLRKYKAFVKDLASLDNKLTVSDSRGIGIGEIVSQIERHQPRVYFLDYLTLAKMGGEGGWKEIGNFTKQLKDVAGRYGTTIVAAAQLNRDGVGKEPATADNIAESDSIGQDADVIITLKKKTNRVVKARLAKLRNGAGDYLWWNKFDLANGEFHEITKSEGEDLMDDDAAKIIDAEERAGR